jgi:hypothetical protein
MTAVIIPEPRGRARTRHICTRRVSVVGLFAGGLAAAFGQTGLLLLIAIKLGRRRLRCALIAGNRKQGVARSCAQTARLRRSITLNIYPDRRVNRNERQGRSGKQDRDCEQHRVKLDAVACVTRCRFFLIRWNTDSDRRLALCLKTKEFHDKAPPTKPKEP